MIAEERLLSQRGGVEGKLKALQQNMIKKRKMQSSVERVNERCVGESERKEVRAVRETEQRGAEDRVTRTRWMENKGSSGKSEGSWGDVLLTEPHGKVVVIVQFQICFFIILISNLLYSVVSKIV